MNSYYTETKTSQLICTSNQLTDFYMTRVYTGRYFLTDNKNTQTQTKFIYLYQKEYK